MKKVIFLCLCIICCLVVVETRAITIPFFNSKNTIDKIDKICESVFESNYNLLITLQGKRIYIQEVADGKHTKKGQSKIQLMKEAQNDYKSVLSSTVKRLYQNVSSIDPSIRETQVKNSLKKHPDPKGKNLKQSLIDKIESNSFLSKRQRDDLSY